MKIKRFAMVLIILLITITLTGCGETQKLKVSDYLTPIIEKDETGQLYLVGYGWDSDMADKYIEREKSGNYIDSIINAFNRESIEKNMAESLVVFDAINNYGEIKINKPLGTAVEDVDKIILYMKINSKNKKEYKEFLKLYGVKLDRKPIVFKIES